MVEPHFDRLRSEVGDAVRQPDFTTVRRRARQVRRRRAVTSGAAFLATVLTVTGLGYAVQNGPDHRRTAVPAPAASGDPADVWPRLISVTAAGTDLYGVLKSCWECDPELYASADGGASWQSRTVPPAPPDNGNPRTGGVLISLGPETVAWRERRTVSVDEALRAARPSSDGSTVTSQETPVSAGWLWITTDGGRTWRQAAAGTTSVPAVPAGTRPLDCDLLRIATCTVGVIDPVTGRFAPLAGQPAGITLQPGWTSEVNVPFDGRLWVPGWDPATNKPAVATSADAGRTWKTHVFAGAVVAGSDHQMYLPKVAAGAGATAYALTYRTDGTADTYYTTDGGTTWRRGDTIRAAASSAGYVAADGAHIVGTGTGFLAARGTGRYTPVTLTGFPADPAQTTQVTGPKAAARYVVGSESGPYLSEDGRTWRRVCLP